MSGHSSRPSWRSTQICVSTWPRRHGSDNIVTVPPVIVNVPPTEGLPGWVAPLVGFIGVLVGLVGNNLLIRAREQQQFARDKKLELYLELQNSEYEIRRWLPLQEPVRPDWLDKNARWASLQLRLALFASPEVARLGNKFWNEMHQWLMSASAATETGSLPEKEREQLVEYAQKVLLIHGNLYEELRKDLGVARHRESRGRRASASAPSQQ